MKRWSLRLIVVLFLLLQVVIVGAQSKQTAQPTNKTNQSKTNEKVKAFNVGAKMDKLSKNATDQVGDMQTPGGLGIFVETIVILTLFVLGIYGVFRFVQKKKGTTFSADETIKTRASLSVGGTKMLQIVEIGDKMFFIGVADSAINLISEIDDEGVKTKLRESSDAGNSGKEGFLDKLISVIGKAPRKVKKGLLQNRKDFLATQKDRIKKMGKK